MTDDSRPEVKIGNSIYYMATDGLYELTDGVARKITCPADLTKTWPVTRMFYSTTGETK